MIDRLMYTNGLNNDDQKALFQVKENIEKIVIRQKKQKDIQDETFFKQKLFMPDVYYMLLTSKTLKVVLFI